MRVFTRSEMGKAMDVRTVSGRPRRLETTGLTAAEVIAGEPRSGPRVGGAATRAAHGGLPGACGRQAPTDDMRRIVDRVEALVQAKPELPFSVEMLAASVGVSRRTLHRCYEHVRGVGPMEAVKRRRLVRARCDLLSSDASTCVTDVALRWGFTHLGRFAAVYCAYFGERPSDTLRRAREGAVPRRCWARPGTQPVWPEGDSARDQPRPVQAGARGQGGRRGAEEG